MTQNEKLFTVGEISEQLGEPIPRVAYVIQKYRLKPVERVGIIRRFSGDQIAAIKKGLYGIQIRGNHGQ